MDSDKRAPHAGPLEPDDPPSTCASCATPAEDPGSVLTWTLEVEDDGSHRWVCPDCSRDHVRDIEARLDLESW